MSSNTGGKVLKAYFAGDRSCDVCIGDGLHVRLICVDPCVDLLPRASLAAAFARRSSSSRLLEPILAGWRAPNVALWITPAFAGHVQTSAVAAPTSESWDILAPCEFSARRQCPRVCRQQKPHSLLTWVRAHVCAGRLTHVVAPPSAAATHMVSPFHFGRAR